MIIDNTGIDYPTDDRFESALTCALSHPTFGGGLNWLVQWEHENAVKRRDRAQGQPYDTCFSHVMNQFFMAWQKTGKPNPFMSGAMPEQVFVPGQLQCVKCGFVLTKVGIHPDGSSSAINEPDDCPNGCGPLWKVTERERRVELAKGIEELMLENMALKREIEELKQRPVQVVTGRRDVIGYQPRANPGDPVNPQPPKRR